VQYQLEQLLGRAQGCQPIDSHICLNIVLRAGELGNMVQAREDRRVWFGKGDTVPVLH